MVSVCLPSDALSQHLPSYLGFSYLGRGVSLHSCSSKMQPLLLTLEEGYLLTAAQPSCARTATTPWMWGCSSWLPPLTLDMGLLLSAASPDLASGVAPLGHSCAIATPDLGRGVASLSCASAQSVAASALLCSPLLPNTNSKPVWCEK